ncbi:DUF2535 family protein [Bacillus sp. PS06]|nr:DUF2535 family protein [Bacillus sp. PS06]MBD8069133.1 DUF2535 family protein [Bacillus sp. PS06]
MLYKTLEFKNVDGQFVKIIDIPFLDESNHYYFMVQIRLQKYLSSLYQEPQIQDRTSYSFRDYMKRKLKWADYKELFELESYKNNA